MKKYRIHFFYLLIIATLAIASRYQTSELEDGLQEAQQVAERAQIEAQRAQELAMRSAEEARKMSEHAEMAMMEMQKSLEACQQK